MTSDKVRACEARLEPWTSISQSCICMPHYIELYCHQDTLLLLLDILLRFTTTDIVKRAVYRGSLFKRAVAISAVYPRFLNIFTLIFRALGRKYIPSTQAKAIATLGDSAIICGTALNSTISSSINIIGLTTVDGRCSGTQYSARMAPGTK